MTTDIPGPLLWLRGEKAALGPFVRDLVDDYWRWEQDPRSLIGYGRTTPESLEARTAGYESQARNTHNQTRFTIYDLTGAGPPRPVGTCALLIDHIVRTAEYVAVLGQEGRGRGIGTEATVLALDYAFHIVNLRSVRARILEPNVEAIRLSEKAGFAMAGRLRQAGYWLGRECDEILVDVVPDDLPLPSRVVSDVEGPDDPPGLR